MNKMTIKDLIDKYAAETLSEEEARELARMLEDENQRAAIEELISESYMSNEYASPETTGQKARFEQLMQERMKQAGGTVVPSAHRIHLLRTAWLRYAAVFLLTIGLATLVYLQINKPRTDQSVTYSNRQMPTEIGPGSEKAILTLADGTTIELDKANTGAIAKQGSSSIIKLEDGQVAYNTNELPQHQVMMNNISTPRGGQFRLTLPDGTGVWLNAASSITYPVAFTEQERRVQVSGEVYFEVAKNKHKPFIVDINDKATVQVIGTHFNIHSYPDENDIQTTLIEGSISLMAGQSTVARSPVILKPGQQAVMNVKRQTLSRHLFQVRTVDTSQAIAWKHGIFNFNGADLQSVMKQLERWYDIEVQYEHAVPSIIFKGKMYRNVKLADVLDMLTAMGVRYKMEGKTIIIKE